MRIITHQDPLPGAKLGGIPRFPDINPIGTPGMFPDINRSGKPTFSGRLPQCNRGASNETSYIPRSWVPFS
ncbi:hypothetical protein RSAG8_12338, partial [Rhizoctonia solani AG-8 WAC10335]